jgi:hypothetical protein
MQSNSFLIGCQMCCGIIRSSLPSTTRHFAFVPFPDSIAASTVDARLECDAIGNGEARLLALASPTDADHLAIELFVLRPDGRRASCALRFGCCRSRWLRQRRHLCRVADAARIADRTIEPSGIRGPRRNAAYAGILSSRSAGRRQNRKDGNGQQYQPFKREDRTELRVFHHCDPLPLVHPARTTPLA